MLAVLAGTPSWVNAQCPSSSILSFPGLYYERVNGTLMESEPVWDEVSKGFTVVPEESTLSDAKGKIVRKVTSQVKSKGSSEFCVSGTTVLTGSNPVTYQDGTKGIQYYINSGIYKDFDSYVKGLYSIINLNIN